MLKVEKVLNLVKKEIPDFNWDSYLINEEGWEKRCIIVDSQKVISLMRKPEYLNKYINHRMLLSDLSQKCTVSVPQYFYISLENNFVMYNIIEGDFVTYEYIIANKELQTKIGTNIGNFLYSLHSLPLDKYNLTYDSLFNEYDEILRDVEQYLKVNITNNEYNLVIDFLKYYESLISRKIPKCIIHADFRSDHILWDKKKERLGVIDFGDCCIGDPAKDFAFIFEYKSFNIFSDIIKKYALTHDEHFYERIDAHIRKKHLITMLDALKGYPCSYEIGYNHFFDIKKNKA